MLKFPDGTQVRVNGLDEIMEELYNEGRKASQETGEEILKRLETMNNYIPSSARREYRGVVLKEYREYAANRKNNAQSKGGSKNEPGEKDR
jgi:hypothetical protein